MNCHEDGSLDCGGSYGLGKKVHVSITVQTIYVLGYGEAEEKKWRLHLSTVSEVVKAGTGGENCVTSQDYSHHTSGGTAAFCNSPDCGLAWTGLCWTQCSWHRKGRSSLLLKRHLFYARHWASSLTCIISLTFHNKTIFTCFTDNKTKAPESYLICVRHTTLRAPRFELRKVCELQSHQLTSL